MFLDFIARKYISWDKSLYMPFIIPQQVFLSLLLGLLLRLVAPRFGTWMKHTCKAHGPASWALPRAR